MDNVDYPFILITLCSTMTWTVVPVRVLPMGQIELFNHLTMCKQITDVKIESLVLNSNTCNPSTEQKQMEFGFFKNVSYKQFV